MNYKKILQQTEYDFIKTNEHLGKHVILLALAGSYSYGTNIETSDIDIRGITLNQKSDLMGLTQFEQYVDENTDTVIYAFNKIVTLLLSCNPNTIELLGLNPELETEIFVNANMTHYHLRDYSGMWNTMANVVRDYEKIGKRNKKKDDLHLNKHAMHLIRLFMMALDILEKGEINTYREKEHDLLMDIRFGKYQKEDGTFHESFYEMLSDFEKKLHCAAENTDLPEEPDMTKVQELVMTINERVIRDEI